MDPNLLFVLTILSVLVMAVVCFLFTTIPTVLIELPIIYFGKVTDNVKFIIALNVFTNALFNAVSVVILMLGLGSISYLPMVIWYALAELVLIPICEANLYKKISDASFIRILLVTYLANILSCLMGLAISFGIFAAFGTYFIAFK
ncbi:MAG: hypothetical protein J5515_05200 [Lachnospiraceae bacterium]|nr:hypothetical protein [Lachnospiraceae bacterium]